MQLKNKSFPTNTKHFLASMLILYWVMHRSKYFENLAANIDYPISTLTRLLLLYYHVFNYYYYYYYYYYLYLYLLSTIIINLLDMFGDAKQDYSIVKLQLILLLQHQ